MTGELVTGLWELEYRGLLFGGDTDYRVLESDIPSMPDIKATDVGMLHGHGSHVGLDYVGSRSITLVMEVEKSNTNGDPEALGPLIETLRQAMTPAAGESPLVFRHRGVGDGRKVRCNARPRRMDVPGDLELYQGVSTITLELFCADPRYYADDQSYAANIALEGGTDSGLTWPLTWPLEWGEGGSGEFTATNSGNFPADITFTIPGPVTNPRIENITEGKTLALTLDVLEGETLVIDTASSTVTVNGVNRYDALAATSEWFKVGPPGSNIRYRALSGTGPLAATWRSAWV